MLNEVQICKLHSDLLYFTEIKLDIFFSQNHGMVEVGRDLCRSSGTTPIQAGTPRAHCPEYFLADFKDLQGWRFQNLS